MLSAECQLYCTPAHIWVVKHTSARTVRQQLFTTHHLTAAQDRAHNKYFPDSIKAIFVSGLMFYGSVSHVIHPAVLEKLLI